MPKHGFGANAPTLSTQDRRQFLRGAASGLVGASVGVSVSSAVSAAPIEAVTPDPAFAAISAHRIATWNVDTSKAEDESAQWHAVLNKERDAWLVLTHTAPTTVAGLVAYTAYLAGIRGWRDTITEGWTEAVHSIARANARLFPHEAALAVGEGA